MTVATINMTKTADDCPTGTFGIIVMKGHSQYGHLAIVTDADGDVHKTIMMLEGKYIGHTYCGCIDFTPLCPGDVVELTIG